MKIQNDFLASIFQEKKEFCTESWLLKKSREAVLASLRAYVDPLSSFRYETYTILMVIAWTYLLHAYLESKQIDFRYYKTGKKKKLDKTRSGEVKYWELEKCLKSDKSPIDVQTTGILLKLVNLRHEIEHRFPRESLKDYSHEFEASFYQFDHYIGKLFSQDMSLRSYLSYDLKRAFHKRDSKKIRLSTSSQYVRIKGRLSFKDEELFCKVLS